MKTNKIIILTLAVAMAFPLVTCAQPKQVRKTTVEVKKDTLATLTEKATAGDAVAQNTLGTWYYNGKNVQQDYETALAWWKKSASQGNAYAIGNMAMCYQLGHGIRQDSVMAMKLYKQAAKKGNKEMIASHEKLAEQKGNTFSCMLLYELYNTGTGVKRDAAKAAYYLERIAAAGDAAYQFQLALLYLNNNQAGKAYPWFKAAADKGVAGAIYYQGRLLHQGMGIGQDKTKGIRLMQRAEEEGFMAAANQLGRIFYEGDGVERDYAKAVGYLQKASNNANAQWLLGLSYLNGQGVDQDFYFAAQWLAEASVAHEKDFNILLKEDNEGAFSQYLMGLRHYYIDKDYDGAIGCFKKVEKAKIAEGKTMQAVCLVNPDYAKRNDKKAAKLLSKAVNASPVANYYLSSLYEKGRGVKNDKAKAMELLQKAADSGIACAQCKLGDLYMAGNGVSKDFSKAALLYLQAEKQRHLSPQSAKNLAQCYQKRIAVLPDLDQAEKRVEQLKNQKENTRLLTLLKALNN